MAVKVAPKGKPEVLMMTMLMPYLRDSLESKFDLHPLWEQPNKEQYLASKGDCIRAVVTSGISQIDSKFIDKLPNLEIVSSFSVGLDKVRTHAFLNFSLSLSMCLIFIFDWPGVRLALS